MISGVVFDDLQRHYGPNAGVDVLPENVIGLASVYLRDFIIGMPATMVYNFGSAILRAKGDTPCPLASCWLQVCSMGAEPVLCHRLPGWMWQVSPWPPVFPV